MKSRWTPAKGVRNMVRAGYRWHVFADFPCNASGVRIAVRRGPVVAMRIARTFARRNNVETYVVMR